MHDDVEHVAFEARAERLPDRTLQGSTRQRQHVIALHAEARHGDDDLEEPNALLEGAHHVELALELPGQEPVGLVH
ncbi:MAG: hypothetical protein ACNA8R_00530, partial [Nitriliruptoraceae bacterium]